MIDLRLRSQLSNHAVSKMVGKLLTDRERALDLTGPATVRKPNGQLLCVYLPGALQAEMREGWDVLSAIRTRTNNRGAASASKTQSRRPDGSGRTEANDVTSSILGSFEDKTGPMSGTCRLTAFTAQNLPKFNEVVPILQRMDAIFRGTVPDRYEAQAEYADRTEQDWIIPGTVYTTITINNTYPTGVHTDKGDLDAGFSCLAVARRGDFTGGVLTFPKFGVGVDMQDGDLILMDAHEHHGNTPMQCSTCGERLTTYGHQCFTEEVHLNEPERVSVVAYYRTLIERCDTLEREQAKRTSKREARNAKHLNL